MSHSVGLLGQGASKVWSPRPADAAAAAIEKCIAEAHVCCFSNCRFQILRA